MQESRERFTDTTYSWEYGSKIKSYKFDSKPEPSYAASEIQGFKFRTAESFLNSLNKQEEVDLTKYEIGQRVYHKKFGEGTISNLEEEGNDIKVDIDFDKAGHKRLMARFAGLEIIA